MSSELVTQILLAVLACAWVGDFVRGLFQKKLVKADANKSEANATQVIVGTATTLVVPLSNRIKELETETTILRNSLREANEEIARTTKLLNIANNRIEATTAENKRVTNENRRLRLQLGEV